VTLSGRVDDQNAHEQALQTARNTDGVRSVEDKLVVGPASAASGVPEQMSAALITAKIQAKYFTDADVKARDVNVSTTNGVVTLSGRVETEAERQKAYDIARTTEGVTRVENGLIVQPSGGAVATTGTAVQNTGRAVVNQMDDARITSTIQSKYFLDDMVKGRRINVDSTQGVVTLRGEVTSESERAQALLLARATEGVQRVEDNLTVTGAAGATGSPGAGPTGSVGSAPDDETLTTRIQAKFYQDAQVRPGNIEVTSKDGVVLLQGTVPNAAARKKAVGIAQDTDGVAQVVDRLKVGKAPAAPGKK
jgi:hyperosmotically inducible protein